MSSRKFVLIGCRLQQDSNSDRRSRRETRWPLDHHHGPTQERFALYFEKPFEENKYLTILVILSKLTSLLTLNRLTSPVILNQLTSPVTLNQLTSLVTLNKLTSLVTFNKLTRRWILVESICKEDEAKQQKKVWTWQVVDKWDKKERQSKRWTKEVKSR